MSTIKSMNPLLPAQTISERCDQNTRHEECARSNGKPVVSGLTSNMDVRFAPISNLPVQIKHLMKNMTKHHASPAISRPQIMAQVKRFTTSLNGKPLADLMLHPEKIEPLLRAHETGKAVSPRTTSRDCSGNSRPLTSKRPGRGARFELKNTEFFLAAPEAESVRLVADFTGWHQAPLDMIKSEYGVWYLTVPLPPGAYAYCFIVDGTWCDYSPAQFVKKSSGGITNSVITVA